MIEIDEQLFRRLTSAVQRAIQLRHLVLMYEEVYTSHAGERDTDLKEFRALERELALRDPSGEK